MSGQIGSESLRDMRDFDDDEFLEEVRSLTSNVFTELKNKWKSMHECSNEFLHNRRKKFVEYLSAFYNDILVSEERKQEEMIDQIDKKLMEFHKLQKELHLSESMEFPWTEEREPYTLFLQEIDNCMRKYEEMRDKRLEHLKSLREQEKELCDLLELPALPKFPNPIPNDQQLDDVESHIFTLREEKINRIAFFNEAKQRIIKLMREMEYDAESDFEIEVLTVDERTFVPSTTKVNNLRELKDSIERQYEEKIEYRALLLEKLNKLWDRIKVEQDERDSFLARYSNVCKSHMKALNDEIVRCEEIKLANIKPIVDQLRQEILTLWDLLTYSDEQRKEFKAFLTDHYSEDVLDLHELEIENLKLFYQKYQHIYELADKREKYWQRMLHLDEIAMDKTRLFNNRGGQLLKEEKERKSLEINLPKVDKQLKSALADFHKNEDRPFLWFGENLLEKITRDWEGRIEAKESKKLARIFEKIRELNVISRGHFYERTPSEKVENQKQIEVEAKLGSRQLVSKRKMGTPLSSVSEAKTRRHDDYGSQTIILKGGGVRTPRRLPNIRTPLNISTASIASYSHFQDGLEKSELGAATPRSALKEVGNRVPGVGHSSPTLITPVGRRGTPASTIKSAGRNPSTIPRMAAHRTRLHLDF